MAAGSGSGRLSRALVIGELSIAVVLLVCAGLLTTSLARLSEVYPCFDAQGVLTFSISLPGTQYERPDGTNRFFRELEERIEALPGVRSAGVVWPLPLSGRAWSNNFVAGAVREGDRRYAEYRLATPDLFETMGIPILHGNTFSDSQPRHVVLVSRNLAEHAWPSSFPIGQSIQANPWGGGLETFEVAGVVDDVRSAELGRLPRETIYFDARGWSWTNWEVDFVVRVEGKPDLAVAPIRKELAAMNASIPMARVRTMSTYVEDHLVANRFALTLTGLFAIVAAILALVGLYGVVSYSVSQCAHEIGVRMALGADQRSIAKWVLARAALLTACGVGLGLVASLLVTRLLTSLLFSVAPSDPVTFLVAASIVSGTALGASLSPARRATKLDPMAVLRSE